MHTCMVYHVLGWWCGGGLINFGTTTTTVALLLVVLVVLVQEIQGEFCGKNHHSPHKHKKIRSPNISVKNACKKMGLVVVLLIAVAQWQYK